ncbi:MAG: isoleucine--tRNA ligase [Phycisphaerae bacterium]
MSKGSNTYKDTLNLPRTDFDMRAKLLEKEPAIQAKWYSEDLYGQIRKARDGAKRFVLHDGPPYANGDIHMGHALNKVLKDMVVKVKTMTGFDAPYLPGWDCHGLPIEQKVLDDLGSRAGKVDPMDIRRKCYAVADKFTHVQSEQFRRLGVLGEFDKPYITMAPQYEASVMEIFARLVEQGLVFRQLKPVHWSIDNRTALAEAELEYHQREDDSIYVLFPVEDGADALPHRDGDSVYLMVWTTTPWTIPANLAVAAHPGFSYAAVHAETENGPVTFVVAEELAGKITQVIAEKRPGFIKSHEIVGRLNGQDLIDAKITYRHPLTDEKVCPVVPAEYVTLEEGTGLVHTAPGHGMEDYGTALKQDLGIYCPVLPDGTFDETAPDFLVGQSVWDGNPLVCDKLAEKKLLALRHKITHSYPHDWRSKGPTIFRATKQWFVAVDRPLAEGKKSLRDLAIDACRSKPQHGGVRFIPAWGQNRLADMLQTRPDWCISRQRAWGLPIPVFYNAADEALMTPASVRAAAEFIAREGSDAWFTFTPRQILDRYDPAEDPDVENPERFDVDELTAGVDILDVWFESGSSWFAAAIRRNLIHDIPVDMYLEGSDQHRGWFQLSLLPALGARGKPPFRTVLTHGFVVTEDGYKMSKSLGNAVDVIKQLEGRGADLLRLWAAWQDYRDDVRCSDNLIGQAEDTYRKIRNTLRFCMGACFDFDPAENSTEPAPHSVDLWMRMELHRLIRDVRDAYENYEFHKATRRLYEFCAVEASSTYLQAVKDRLYCESPDAVRRRASQTVIHEMLVALVKMLAPIIPHTAEEAWDYIPNRPGDAPHSVHLTMLPEYDEEVLELAEDLTPVNPDLAHQWSSDVLIAGPAWIWDRLMDLRDRGLNKLEKLRNSGVKNSLDAEAVFKVRKDDEASAGMIETYLHELEDLLGVGHARLERVDSLDGDTWAEVEVIDTRDKYARCARSWKRRPDVGTDEDYPDLSARDAVVMKELSGE